MGVMRVLAWENVLTFLRKLIRKKGGFVGALILVALVFGAVFAPWVAPFEPDQTNAVDAMRPPSLEYPMGTDKFGRDIFSRVLWGGRLSLQIGLIAVGIGAVTGGVIGLVAGYLGGRVDNFLMRLMDVMLAFPGILLALVMVVMLGPGMSNLMIAVGISSVPRFARLIRSSVLSIRNAEFVEAARSVGAGDQLIMFRHILPNVLAPVVIYGTLRVGTAILSAASLSFLGLGAEPPTPEWGLMVSVGRNYLRTAWWMSMFPGIVIAVTVISLNLLGDALRDILDPRLKNVS